MLTAATAKLPPLPPVQRSPSRLTATSPMAATAPSAALAWLAWLLAACGWVIMLAGTGALQDVSAWLGAPLC